LKSSVSRLVDPISSIQQRAAEDLTLVDWATTSNLTFIASIAKRGTVCIPVVSSFAGEGTDRNLTLLHNGDELIKTVADNCDNTIVVVQSVGPVDMEAWIEHPNVTAIVWSNLGGQELGPALVDILYGKVNPSGRLVYTIAKKVSDYAQGNIVKDPQPYPQINYTEGVSVDYRGFEKAKKTPRFWFGHGLSYSSFTYNNLKIQAQASLNYMLTTSIQYVADSPGGDSALYDVAVVVSFDIRNEGPYDGVEIPQLYLRLPDEGGNPTKILRGFENVRIRDEETQTVYLYLTRKDISYWNTVKQNWETPKGDFGVFVGASSNDIRLNGTFSI
jgi:beta-glucosidase